MNYIDEATEAVMQALCPEDMKYEYFASMITPEVTENARKVAVAAIESYRSAASWHATSPGVHARLAHLARMSGDQGCEAHNSQGTHTNQRMRTHGFL